MVIGAGFVLAVVVVVLVGGRPATSTPLDPDNPGPQGARALARVLDGQGVDVRVARGADALEAESLGPGATVVVTSSYLLGRSTADRLLTHLAGADLVVVEPEPGAVDALGLAAPTFSVVVPGNRLASCDDPLLDGLEIRVDLATEYDVPDGCFPGEHGMIAAVPRPGVTLLGAADLLTNDQVLRADNAAVALRLLGQRDRLVWYVPEVEDLVGDDGVGLRTLLPDWIFPGLWIAGASRRRAAALAVAAARPAGHRAAARRGEGDRDRHQPRPALPPLRRPGPCRPGAAPRRPQEHRRAAAPARARGPAGAGPRRRPARRPPGGTGGRPARRRRARTPPPTTT